jgi:23S rRNA (guanosine2251-2'-O)-methyltransferase
MVAQMKSAGYRVVCTDTERAVSIYDAPLQLPLLMVIGGEKRGIRREVLSLADATVKLEYGRDFPAALSAASAAGIVAFEVLRRNR